MASALYTEPRSSLGKAHGCLYAGTEENSGLVYKHGAVVSPDDGHVEVAHISTFAKGYLTEDLAQELRTVEVAGGIAVSGVHARLTDWDYRYTLSSASNFFGEAPQVLWGVPGVQRTIQALQRVGDE